MIHELKIKDKVIKVMEQPAKYVLDLEKKYLDSEVVDYVKDILKYPAGQNPSINEIIDIPKELNMNGVVVSLEKDGKIDLNLVETLFFSINQNKPNPAYLGEKVIKLAGLSIDSYKYKDLVEIGTEAFKQIGEFAYLIQIREFFRSL